MKKLFVRTLILVMTLFTITACNYSDNESFDIDSPSKVESKDGRSYGGNDRGDGENDED